MDLNPLDLLRVFESKHPPRIGRTLVAGSKIYSEKPDRRLRYFDPVGVDMEPGDGVDIVMDLEKDDVSSLGRFAHIDCCSVLEHVQRPWVMAANLERLLVDGGTILVAVPWVWRQHGYPNDYWRMNFQALEIIFPNIEWIARRLAAGGKLRKKMLNPSVDLGGGQPALCRSEVLAFGMKRPTPEPISRGRRRRPMVAPERVADDSEPSCES